MIFIAGVQPKTTVVDRTPRLCPACGLVRARLQRVDHYFSVFFIPVLRVKKGAEFIYCDRCERPVSGMSTDGSAGPTDTSKTCAACGQPLEKSHRFCPHCGHPRRKNRSE